MPDDAAPEPDFSELGFAVGLSDFSDDFAAGLSDFSDDVSDVFSDDFSDDEPDESPLVVLLAESRLSLR